MMTTLIFLSSFWSIVFLQGARNLSKPPLLTEIMYATLEKARNEEKSVKGDSEGEQKQEDDDEVNRGLKRKLDSGECRDDQGGEDSQEAKRKGSNELKKIKKAKNVGALDFKLLENLCYVMSLGLCV